MTKQVVEQADHLIDLHGGDLDENLRPYSYWAPTGNARQDQISREMAMAFGLDTIIISRDRPRDPNASRYLETTASLRGKPSITAEAGRSGPVANDDVNALVNGCVNVMRYLHMLAGAPHGVANPVWIDHVATVTGDVAGIFYPAVDRSQFVARGMKLGTITDYIGKVLAEPTAPEAGVVLYVNALPTMNKGDAVANVGVVATQSPQ
jgi:predicted deacylase